MKPSVHYIDQCSVLHVHAFHTTHVLRQIFVHCMGSIFLYCFSSYETGWGLVVPGWSIFFFIFFLLAYFFKCRGMHCLVNHLCTALLMFLYYMLTYSALHIQVAFSFRVFALPYSFFQCTASTALLGMCALHSTQSCTAFVHVLHCMHPICALHIHLFCALLESNDT